MIRCHVIGYSITQSNVMTLMIRKCRKVDGGSRRGIGVDYAGISTMDIEVTVGICDHARSHAGLV